MKTLLQPSNTSVVSRKRSNGINRLTTSEEWMAMRPTAPSKQTIVQPKLELTQPGDSYEQEADRIADFIMRKEFSGNRGAFTEQPSRTSMLPPVISRKANGSSGVAVSPATESGINASRGGGHPMPDALRAKMEGGFGADFSGVRLHTGSRAADLSSSIAAKAFTYGNDIFFNSGQYQPHSAAGQHLIAHELTHVVQQNGKVGRYRKRTSFNFGVADNNVMKEDEFDINVDEKTKPYIDLITIVFDEVAFDTNGNPFCRGIGGARYKHNPKDNFCFPLSGGGDILGNGSLQYFTNRLRNKRFKVTDIKGDGFNSGTYTDFSEINNFEGPNKRYTKADSMGNRSANMSLAVFFNRGEALHHGCINTPSHGCIHVEWGEMLRINYHSVKNLTEVDIIYLDIENRFSNLRKRKKQKRSSRINVQNQIHPKLELTQPGDSYEREADRMADFVMRKAFSGSSGMSVAHPSRTSALPPIISRQANGVSSGVAVSPATESGINASRGGGHPMPNALCAKMEGGFGVDFSGVRLHTGSRAADLSSSIAAKAFTYGNDIFFNSGQYQPHSAAGQHLIAHELTHVVQQSGKVGREPYPGPTIGPAPVQSEDKAPNEENAVLSVVNLINNIYNTINNWKSFKESKLELKKLLKTLKDVAETEIDIMRSSKDVVSLTMKHSASMASKGARIIGWAGVALALSDFYSTIKILDLEESPRSSSMILGIKLMNISSCIISQPILMAKIAVVNPAAAAIAFSFGTGFTIGDTINTTSEILFGKAPGEALVDVLMNNDPSKITEEDVIKFPYFSLGRLREVLGNVKSKLKEEEKKSYTLDKHKVDIFWREYTKALKGRAGFLFMPSDAKSFLNAFFKFNLTRIKDTNVTLTKVDVKCLKEAFVKLGLY